MIAIVALVAAVVIFPVLGLHPRTAQGSNEGFFQIGTGSNRAPAWSTAVDVANQQALWGHGFGTTPVIFPQVQSLTEQNQILGRTHNSYLEAAIDLGWPGTACLFLLGVSGVVAAFRVARRPGPWQAVGTMLLAGAIGGLVEGIFESGMLAAGGLFAFPFWTVVALAHSVRLAQRADLPA
jgi:O-antigen ligase